MIGQTRCVIYSYRAVGRGGATALDRILQTIRPHVHSMTGGHRPENRGVDLRRHRPIVPSVARSSAWG